MARPRGGVRRIGRPDRELRVGEIARQDLGRTERTGVPEVILAEGKRPEDLLRIVRALARAGRGALISRPQRAHLRALRGLQDSKVRFREFAGRRVLLLEGFLGAGLPRGRVAIVTAGTSDVPTAEEAEAILRCVGVRVRVAHDVGVAGLHRLLRAVRRSERFRPQVYLVFAGREGALPTVVAGLVRAPVVGVPTSTGYGTGRRGTAALHAMLQSCAPLAVVNIDAGVSAALFALHVLAGSSRARARGSSADSSPVSARAVGWARASPRPP